MQDDHTFPLRSARAGMSLVSATMALAIATGTAADSMANLGNARATPDGETFTDSSGRTYTRDKKGTIRRGR